MTVEQKPMPGEALIPLLERKRMIDGAWIVCLVAVLIAVALPWFLSILDIDLAKAAWCVFVYALVYLALSAFTDRLGSTVAVAAAIRVTTLASVVFLGVLWHLVGGLDNPMFLLAFTLPVIMSGVMMVGRHSQLTALISVIVVTVVAVAESPDLRWYLERFHVSLAALPDLGSDPMFARTRAFAGLQTGPAYEFTLIETFAVMQFIVAFLSAPLAALMVRISARLETSSKLLTEVQGLFHAVLRAEPDPGVIIYADTGQVVQASDSFFKRMLLRPSQLVGKGLFEVIRFDQPDRVRRALEAPSGELPFCVYRVDNETRIATLYFYRTEHAGIGYLYLGWQELTELYYLQAAFDAVDDPLLVISTAGRLHYANDPARHLFGTLHFGMDAATVPHLDALVSAHRGQRPGETRMGRHEIAGGPYAVHTLIATLPGEAEACTILWLHSVAREEALFEQAVRDALTGIYNRRYFDDALVRQVERSKRGHKVALAYFDLDNFKNINDELGHAAGDAALLAFVRAAKSQLRETDVFARRGGDEFAVLFVDCETDVASAAIERLHGILSRDGCVYESRKFDVRFSAGLAACHPDDGVEGLLERADRALYAAKEAGKGRWVIES